MGYADKMSTDKMQYAVDVNLSTFCLFDIMSVEILSVDIMSHNRPYKRKPIYHNIIIIVFFFVP